MSYTIHLINGNQSFYVVNVGNDVTGGHMSNIYDDNRIKGSSAACNNNIR